MARRQSETAGSESPTLYQDEVGGLEVLNADGEWVRAPHIPGTFVVNVGDLLARSTSCKTRCR